MAFYRLVSEQRWAIVNKGCSSEELDTAEKRVGQTFHPLHRHLLSLSNGGTVPFVHSISLFAAAVLLEPEWQVIGPLLSDEERLSRPAIFISQIQSIRPTIIERTPESDDLIFIASGFGGEHWGYVSADQRRIDGIIEGLGRTVEARDFEEFLGQQLLVNQCTTEQFSEQVRAILQNLPN